MTPEEDGGYSVCFPDLDGCYSCGDDFIDAVVMAEDAAKTFVSFLLKEGDKVPKAKRHDTPEGDESVWVTFEADPSYIVEGPVVSAAEAARRLNLSRARITSMLNSGLLDGYRTGRHTYVTEKSIKARLKAPRSAGRPKKTTA